MSILSETGHILCQIPPEMRTSLLSGAIKVTGSVLRETGSGRIVGFLQEASPVSQFLGDFAGPLGAAIFGEPVMLAGAALTAGTQALGLLQGEATRRAVNRTEATVEHIDQRVALLHTLSKANLALSAAGIGVSLIGFGIMAARLTRLQTSIRSLGDRFDALSDKIDLLRQDAIEDDFSDLLSLSGLYEESWSLSGDAQAEKQWHHIQQKTLMIQNRFANRAQKLLRVAHASIDAVDPILDAVALASGLRVASFLACNESDLADIVAKESFRQIDGLTGAISLVDLVAIDNPEAIEPGTVQYEVAQAEARVKARPLLHKLRSREVAVATRTAPLATLKARDIKPRDWLEVARSERDEPVLFLPA